MKAAPYTIITAYHQEIKHWSLGGAQRALLMAFIYCLKLRMDGINPSSILGESRAEANKKRTKDPMNAFDPVI